jgi:hypothetical protein
MVNQDPDDISGLLGVIEMKGLKGLICTLSREGFSEGLYVLNR